jgi:hypothetical protein
MPVPLYTRIKDILDYFGRCEACGYPASASMVVQHFPDGTTEEEIIATCDLPCGWRAPAPIMTMTGDRRPPSATDVMNHAPIGFTRFGGTG